MSCLDYQLLDLGQREDDYDDAIVPDLESVERSDPVHPFNIGR